MIQSCIHTQQSPSLAQLSIWLQIRAPNSHITNYSYGDKILTEVSEGEARGTSGQPDPATEAPILEDHETELARAVAPGYNLQRSAPVTHTSASPVLKHTFKRRESSSPNRSLWETFRFEPCCVPKVIYVALKEGIYNLMHKTLSIIWDPLIASQQCIDQSPQNSLWQGKPALVQACVFQPSEIVVFHSSILQVYVLGYLFLFIFFNLHPKYKSDHPDICI